MTNGPNHLHRALGNSGISVTPVALGCWPISGMTSLDVNEQASLETLHAAWDAGINFFDTAYGYGMAGESERLIARALSKRRNEVVLATKGGISWDSSRTRILDGRPETLRRQCEESLRRLNTDHVDLLYLHAPDPNTPIVDSAAELRRIQESGKALAIGASNFSLAQLCEFQAVCPLAAIQPPYNMLQREIEQDILPWCQKLDIAVCVYWPLMKGLLAGKLPREHQFAKGDGRAKYPMFQGVEWQRNQDFIDELRSIAAAAERTVAQVVVSWTIHQPGITAALCGAKRPEQIRETAGALGWELSADLLSRIDQAIAKRGAVVARPAV